MFEEVINRNIPINKHPYYKDYLSKFNREWDLVIPNNAEKYITDWDLLARLIFGSFFGNDNYMLILDKAWSLNPKGRPIVHLLFQIRKKETTKYKPLEEFSSVQALKLIKILTNEQISRYELATKNEEDLDYEEEKANRLRKFQQESRCVIANAKVSMLI